MLERVGDVLWLRELVVRQGIPFSAQRAIVGDLAARYRPVRIAVDQTGMGEAVTEQLQDDLGTSMVEGVLMTGPRRLDAATRCARRWRTAGSGFRPTTACAATSTPSAPRPGPRGPRRLLAERSGTDGHADRFWALALACIAAAGIGPVTVEGASAGTRAATLADFY